jgi:hypothetical protein
MSTPVSCHPWGCCVWTPHRYYQDPLLGMLIGGKFRAQSATLPDRRATSSGTGHTVEFEEQVRLAKTAPRWFLNVYCSALLSEPPWSIIRAFEYCYLHLNGL